MSQQTFNAYRIMWICVCFDIPTTTSKHRKQAGLFRKNLLKSGFTMFQYSMYLRHCPSRENAGVHKKRVTGFMPKYGKVSILEFTDKQFSMIEVYHGAKEEKPPIPTCIQLQLF